MSERNVETRIAREEEKCWKAYWKEKKAEEAKAKAEMEAAFEDYERQQANQNYNPEPPTDGDERRNRRIQEKKSRKRMQRIASEVEASLDSRTKSDEKAATHCDRRTGEKAPRKSKALRSNKIMKKADKVTPKK